MDRLNFSIGRIKVSGQGQGAILAYRLGLLVVAVVAILCTTAFLARAPQLMLAMLGRAFGSP